MNNIPVKFSLAKCCTEVEVHCKVRACEEKGVKYLSFRPSSLEGRLTFIESDSGIEPTYENIMKAIYDYFRGK